MNSRPPGLLLAAALFLHGTSPAQTPSTSLPPAGGRPIVAGTSYTLRSAVLGDVRRINVRLPEHYRDPGRRFTTLILLDGGEKEDFLHIAGLAAVTAAYGEGRELIVVGVEGVDRRHDLTPPSSVASDRQVAPTSGGADAYRRFLVAELVPWVRARFATDGRTAVIGESLAGLFVLETALRHPDSFDDYVAVSPSLWWDGGRLVADAPALLARGDCRGRRLWLGLERIPRPDPGSIDETALQERLVEALRKDADRGLQWTASRFEEGHSTVYHPAALKALRDLYGEPAR